MAWWGVLGLGLGLILLASLIWARQASIGEAQVLEKDLLRLAPTLSRMRAGELPSPDAVRALEASLLTPMLRAMAEAGDERRQALVTYQNQIETAGLAESLTPANLALPVGRTSVRQSLARLQQALAVLVKQDVMVQARLDYAIQRWLQESPQWGSEEQRTALLRAASTTAMAMNDFFKVERDIVAQVEDLLVHLDRVGTGVGLEGAGGQQELVFNEAHDLAYYRSALLQLGYLGRQELELLKQAQGASSLHAKRVGELLTAARSR